VVGKEKTEEFMPAQSLPKSAVWGLVALFTVAFSAPALANSQLTTGTGKANIDTAPALFPIDNGTGDAPFTGINDSLHARALVTQKDRAKIIIVVADIIDLPDDVYGRITARISKTYGMDKAHIWLTGRGLSRQVSR